MLHFNLHILNLIGQSVRSSVHVNVAVSIGPLESYELHLDS